LYSLAKEKAPHILGERPTFAQFLPWTYEILKFIDNLDIEDVDSDKLKNIQAAAQIGYEVPENINSLLQSIVELRAIYHDHCLKEATYSRGLQYRRASQLIGEVEFPEFDQVLFCNFFYFNRCEEKIVRALYERKLATLIFQGDERKWPVLSRLEKNLGVEIREDVILSPERAKDLDSSRAALAQNDGIRKPAFNLKLHQGFDAHSQMGLVREILKGIASASGRNDKLASTVIVLPNPDNIIPLLGEITSLVTDFNISMGYPLKRSSLFTLFELVFRAQVSKKEEKYYTKDYLNLLRHPFVKNLTLQGHPEHSKSAKDPSSASSMPPQDDTVSKAITRTLIHKIEETLTGKEKTEQSGNLFIELKDIQQLDDIYELTRETLKHLGIACKRKELEETLGVIHQTFFTAWEEIKNFADLAESLEAALDLLVHKSFLKNYPLNINIANRMYELNDEFKSASFRKERFDKEDLFRIFESKISREVVAFAGSPLKGMQILGLLETRSLNFENVIVVDVNEGSLPTLNIYEPLIPREVMVSLGLDRVELEEEIQRYQFMRLISSAKNVHLVYQLNKDKERSRFIEELVWEEEKEKEKTQVVPVQQAAFNIKAAVRQKEVHKTPAVIEFLRNHRYSASSINKYLENPMEFYYTYVLGVKEEDNLLDEPDARHVGTFVHEVLEQSFTPFLNKKPEITAQFRKRFTDIFERQFDATLGKSFHSDGFLLKTIVEDRLRRFLDNEEFNKDREVEKILYLEREFEDTLHLPSGKFQFKYIVDRVDQLKDGTIMIIDYKTGSREVMPKSLERIAGMELSRESIRDNVISFQLPLYFHYLNKQFKNKPINAALYNLRTCSLYPFIGEALIGDTHQKGVYPQSDLRAQIDQTFLRALDFIFAEILNPDVPFVEDAI